jgi:hypothetical protein
VVESTGFVIPGTGNGTLVVTANAGVSTAPSGDILTADGLGNAKDSGVLISALTNAVVKNPTGDQTIATNSLLPASANTTQSLGTASAPWVLNAATISEINPGVFTNQIYSYCTSLIGGAALTDGNFASNSYGITAAMFGAVKTPAGATVINSFGVVGQGVTLADSGVGNYANTGGGYFFGSVLANGGAAWGINPNCGDTVGTTGACITGCEIDLGCNGTPAQFRGLSFYSVGSGTMCAYPNSYFIGFNSLTAAAKPVAGLQINRASVSTVGILLDGLASTNNTPSARISFNGYDSGGTIHQASIQADANGDIDLLPASGGVIQVNNSQIATTNLADCATSLWTTTPTNLTQVGGSATLVAHYTRVGNLVHFTISITPITNTSSSAGSTTFSLPAGLTPARNAVCYAVGDSAYSYGNGAITTAGVVYPPVWSTSTVPVYVSGCYELS